MRIFRKTHFWQDKRTYLELDGEMPRINEKGFVEEGSLNIRIGDESGIRAAFKMDTDELRSMVDVITLFLKEHDAKMMRLYAEREERKEEEFKPVDLSILEPKEEKKEGKPKLQFYY